MSTRISVTETLENEYGTSDLAALYDELLDSVIPACCSEGCQVEPDGICEHGNPSVLLAQGLI